MAEYAKKESLISVLPPRLGHGDVYALGHNTCRNMVEMIIKDFPADDVVAVVRCKECKHYGNTVCGYMCKRWEDWLPTEDDDFCSYGERRGEDG